MIPKRETRRINESAFINKMQVYLKKLKRRKSDKRIRRLKKIIEDIDRQRKPRILDVSGLC